MKGKTYMQASRVKKIDKHTKNHPNIILGTNKQNSAHKEYIRIIVSQKAENI